MRHKNIIGLFLTTSLFFIGFFINGNVSLYFNFSGLLIVLAGTLSSALISFRVEQLKIVAKVILATYTTEIKKETEIVEILIDLSIKSRIEGILSLQEKENETSILFLRRALGCLVDGFHSSQIRDILSTEMYFFKLRREDLERTLRTIADYLPAFGIIGSIIGLVSMIGGIGDTSVILQSVPIALTSTLYGIFFSNYFVIPFANNLRERTSHELLLQKIIMEGVIAIDSEINPVILKTKLESFLTPSARIGELVSYRKLKERFNIKEEAESGPRVND